MDPDVVEVAPSAPEIPSEPSYEAPDIDSILADEPDLPPEPAAAAPEPEPVVEPAAPSPPPEDERIEKGLKVLMDRERELNAARKELEAERAKLEPLRRFEDLERRLKEDDAEGALKELGVKLDEVNRAVIEGRGTQNTGKLQRELQAKLEEIQATTQERLARIEQAEIQRMQEAAQAEVRANVLADKFPMTAAVGDFGVQTIISKTQEHFKRDGQVPTYDQVIGEVEKELSAFVDQIMQSEAVRQRYLSQQSTSDKRLPSPTLTNGAAATVSKRKLPTTETPLPEDREDAIDFILSQME